MSNGDKKRITHVKRIFKDNDTESDTWVDVERIDEVWVEAGGQGSNWQERHYTFDWSQMEEEGAGGTKKTISDPNDDDVTIDIPIRTKLTVTTSGIVPPQRFIHTFLNDETNRSRHTHSRKVYHYDIKEAYLIDGQPPSDPETYNDARGDKDEGQHVEVEVLDEYLTNTIINRDIHGRRIHAHWQQRVWHFEGWSLLPNDPEALTGIINPNAGPQVDPPWRLDPLQNIVNVNWGGLAVIFGAGFSDAPSQKKQKV